jgi:hypothetical protein
MSDTSDSNPTRAGELAQQIVAILAMEGSDTRQRAIQAAMLLLGEVPARTMTSNSGEDRESENDTDLANFFNREENLKPSDYAQLCAAYHFAQYGMTPFTIDELRFIANDAGVVLPDRLDMTLNQATKKGKKLFQSAGRGAFRPTAAAGLAFKERWNVKPGRTPKEGGAGNI